jgi:hypothetical protein
LSRVFATRSFFLIFDIQGKTMRLTLSIFPLFFSIISFSQIYVDTVTFEIVEPGIRMDTSAGNSWQIGKPQKSFFDSSFSAHRAIVTDTVNSYPPADTSRFTFTFYNTSMSCANCLRFWHKYDTDTLKDHCYLDASYDNGNSWIFLQDTVISSWGGQFWWNPDYHLSNNSFTAHNSYMSGKSDGWIESEFCWQWYLPVRMDTIISRPDSMMVRFNFISDTVTNSKEGWMVDNILLVEADESQCSGVREYSEEAISISPNPARDVLYLELKEQTQNPKTISVYNLLSQRVIYYSISGRNSRISLNTQGLESGIYLVALSDEHGNVYRRKFIKE